MYAVFHFSLYLLKIGFRDYLNVFYLVVLPFVFFVINRKNVFNDQATFLLISIPMIILTAVIFNFGSTIKSYKEHQFFIKYKLLGLKPLEVTLGVFLYTLVIQLLSIVFMLTIGALFFDLIMDVKFFLVLTLMFFLVNLLEFAIVILVTSIPFRSSNYMLVAQILYFYQLFLGLFLLDGMFNKPVLAYIFALLNPFTSILKTTASILADNKSLFDFPLELGSLLIISFTLIFLGNKYFKWESVDK